MSDSPFPFILGISAGSHDSAAALLRGAQVVAAIEEEKLSRVRRSRGLPLNALRFCLQQARLRADQIQFVAVARPVRDAAPHDVELSAVALGNVAHEASHAESRMPQWLQEEFPAARVILVDHHVCHAAAAFYPSPFGNAGVLTIDEQGDGKTAGLWRGGDLDVQPVGESAFPDSLGSIYSRMTALAGFSASGDEHKLQWLSSFGVARYAPVLREMLKPKPGAAFSVDQSYLLSGGRERGGLAQKFFDACGWSPAETLTEDQRADLAASMQLVLNETVEALAADLLARCEQENLCLAGGVALNAPLIQHLEECGRFAGIFVQPAAGNAGNALGAALYCAHQVLRLPGRERLEHLFYGPEYSDEEIKEVLENCKLHFSYLPRQRELLAAALEALRGDKILGWFQGRAEFGPRALGARSILASPLGRYVNENLNHFVKHREKFRPFAAVVPEERAADYFEFSPSARFLASVGRVKPAHRNLFASNILAAGAAAASAGEATGEAAENRIRVQVVERKTNPLLWELLSEFGRATGVPVLFNTSFNLFGEPLVCSPRDAVRSFYCSGLDHLMIGPFSLSK